MSKIFAKLTAVLGSFVASTTSGACYWGWVEEAEMPESLLK